MNRQRIALILGVIAGTKAQSVAGGVITGILAEFVLEKMGFTGIEPGGEANLFGALSSLASIVDRSRGL